MSNTKMGYNCSSNDKDEDDFDSDDEKDDKESDYIPQTDEAINRKSKEKTLGDSAEVIANHKQAYLWREPTHLERNIHTPKARE